MRKVDISIERKNKVFFIFYSENQGKKNTIIQASQNN